MESESLIQPSSGWECRTWSPWAFFSTGRHLHLVTLDISIFIILHNIILLLLLTIYLLTGILFFVWMYLHLLVFFIYVNINMLSPYWTAVFLDGSNVLGKTTNILAQEASVMTYYMSSLAFKPIYNKNSLLTIIQSCNYIETASFIHDVKMPTKHGVKQGK